MEIDTRVNFRSLGHDSVKYVYLSGYLSTRLAYGFLPRRKFLTRVDYGLKKHRKKGGEFIVYQFRANQEAQAIGQTPLKLPNIYRDDKKQEWRKVGRGGRGTRSRKKERKAMGKARSLGNGQEVVRYCRTGEYFCCARKTQGHSSLILIRIYMSLICWNNKWYNSKIIIGIINSKIVKLLWE